MTAPIPSSSIFDGLSLNNTISPFEESGDTQPPWCESAAGFVNSLSQCLIPSDNDIFVIPVQTADYDDDDYTTTSQIYRSRRLVKSTLDRCPDSKCCELLQELQQEIENLRRDGCPIGYTWSHILVPLIWLCLPSNRARLTRVWATDLGLPMQPLERLAGGMHLLRIENATDLMEWFRAHGLDDKNYEIWNHLSAQHQELIMEATEAGTIIQETILKSLVVITENEGAIIVDTKETSAAGCGEYCMICLESLSCDDDDCNHQTLQDWPAGCGHKFHEVCFLRLVENSTTEQEGKCCYYCPACGLDEKGCQRPISCIHGSKEQCHDRDGVRIGCGTRCSHNRWSRASPCNICHNCETLSADERREGNQNNVSLPDMSINNTINRDNRTSSLLYEITISYENFFPHRSSGSNTAETSRSHEQPAVTYDIYLSPLLLPL